ncbi:Secreted effector protein PipB [Pseudodesulfovibrio hydrargyri]|uniref:Secreted effector protein PipB n=1 Tax=Pseudodesulfovibrio hydrargyri TaxID=2125990 RepID=A0A1J5N6Z1_9BACT|nr:pentapeptide repeat-containing protein [Pseudodesulfovibrio hydrargyri]OIQ49063.1 Secreted effector protein PipB [Pseudodesulfovibrio hydrargyri]
MANPEHVRILLEEGVEAWNKWRKENPEEKPDLSGALLQEANLRGVNLAFANLQKANLYKANLNDADIRGADLSKAMLVKTHLMAAILAFADLQGANLLGGNLQRANLIGTHLYKTNLNGADIRGVNLYGADLSEAHIMGIQYNNIICRSTNVQGCRGNQRFIRHVMDLDFIAEARERYPLKYWLWKCTSNCGRSISLWATISFGLALLFGVAFARYPAWSWLPDWLQSFLVSIAPSFKYGNPEIQEGWFTPYYFSIVTFTTLGFGDVTPTDTAGQLWLAAEVILGYIMLGGLITLFATRMVRQSG